MLLNGFLNISYIVLFFFGFYMVFCKFEMAAFVPETYLVLGDALTVGSITLEQNNWCF